MAVDNKWLGFTMQASAALTDLTAGTGEIYKAVGTTGDITGDDNLAIGILQFGADDGGHVTVGYLGDMKFTAGGAITNGAAVTVSGSGYITTAASGDHIVGRCGISAVGSGAVGRGLFNFANPFAVVNSNGTF